MQYLQVAQRPISSSRPNDVPIVLAITEEQLGHKQEKLLQSEV